MTQINNLGKALVAKSFAPVRTRTGSKAPSAQQLRLELMAKEVIEDWMVGLKPTALAEKHNLTVPEVSQIINRFRKEALEGHRESKEQLATDQIERLRRYSGRLNMMLEKGEDASGKKLTVAQTVRIIGEARRIEKDISELLGITRGTTIQHIQEVKMIKGIDLGAFPDQSEAVANKSVSLPNNSVVEIEVN